MNRAYMPAEIAAMVLWREGLLCSVHICQREAWRPAGGLPLSPTRGWATECLGLLDVPQTVWMACPYQAASLQGSLGVGRAILAANDSGSGSGWQQSKQD